MKRERKAVPLFKRPEGTLLSRQGPKSAIMGHVTEFQENEYLEIRTWVKVSLDSGEGWIRTQKGLNIPMEEAKAFIGKLRTLL